VLFFHASWCPSCKSLDQDILANKAKIPSDTVIFKVDYDLNTPLKTKYGVNAQHTLVSLNSDGTKKSLNRNSPTLADVLKNK
jgi:thiol-disulfide isomerase/thioredoxin